MIERRGMLRLLFGATVAAKNIDKVAEEAMRRDIPKPPTEDFYGSFVSTNHWDNESQVSSFGDDLEYGNTYKNMQKLIHKHDLPVSYLPMNIYCMKSWSPVYKHHLAAKEHEKKQKINILLVELQQIIQGNMSPPKTLAGIARFAAAKTKIDKELKKYLQNA